MTGSWLVGGDEVVRWNVYAWWWKWGVCEDLEEDVCMMSEFMCLVCIDERNELHIHWAYIKSTPSSV